MRRMQKVYRSILIENTSIEFQWDKGETLIEQQAITITSGNTNTTLVNMYKSDTFHHGTAA